MLLLGDNVKSLAAAEALTGFCYKIKPLSGQSGANRALISHRVGVNKDESPELLYNSLLRL
jgi:hypothetical protein